MAGVYGAASDHVPADLAAEGLKLSDRKAPDILGAVDFLQQGHGLSPENSLVPVGTEGDDGNRYACLLLYECYVILEL